MLKSFQLAAILAATAVTAQLTTNIGEESDANKFEEILFSSGGSRHRLPIHRRRNLLQTNDANSDNPAIEANVDGDKQEKEIENEEIASLLQERLLKPKKKDTKDKKKVGNNNYTNIKKKENNKKQDMKDKGKGKFNNYQWKEKEEHAKNDWSWTGKTGKSGGGGGKNLNGGTDDHDDDKWWNNDDHPSKPHVWWNGKAGKKGKAEDEASDWSDWGGWDGNEWNDCICDDGELWRRGRELKNDEVLEKEEEEEGAGDEEVPRSGAAAGKAITTKTESSSLIQQYWQPGGKASKSKSSKGKAKWCSCHHRKITGWPTVKPTTGPEPTRGPTPRPTTSSPTSSKPTSIPTKNPSGAPTSKAPTTEDPTKAPSTSEPTTKPPTNPGPTDCVITESVFNTIAPNAAPPFSYAGFCLAVTDWNTRNPNNQIFMTDEKIYELAAFFGNTFHESDGFTAPREYSSCRESITVNGEVYCKPEGYTGGMYTNRYCSTMHTPTSEPAGCDCLAQVPESTSQPEYVEANLLFFGRGAIHITWNYNYLSAGAAMGVDLCTNPDFAALNGDYVWMSAFWFWTMNTGAVGKTSAQSVAEGSFGGTVNIINGGLECPATNLETTSSVISRLDDYCAASTALGADKLLSFEGCEGLQSQFDTCRSNNSCPSCSGWTTY